MKELEKAIETEKEHLKMIQNSIREPATESSVKEQLSKYEQPLRLVIEAAVKWDKFSFPLLQAFQHLCPDYYADTCFIYGCLDCSGMDEVLKRIRSLPDTPAPKPTEEGVKG